MKLTACVLALSLLAAPAAAQTAVQAPAANPEMQRLFKEDQADRASLNVDWKVVKPRDDARRAATRELLDRGQLKSAEDYKAAAFIFQHGGEPGDYLLAHSLAIVAVAKGDPTATWIASATLDRYLQRIGQKQIYGTQFTRPKAADASYTQEPFDRTLISDALRKELRVHDSALQAKQLQAMEHMRKQQVASKP
jgi:hypothetical protein